VQAVAFYVLIKSAFVGKKALNLSKCTEKQQSKVLFPVLLCYICMPRKTLEFKLEATRIRG
jgi:hypothetical protein